MKKTQICSNCSKTNFPTRDEVNVGSSVMIEKKSDKGTGFLTKGIVSDILTPGNYHPDGLMVDLKNGERGRVKKLVSDKNEVSKNSNDFLALNIINENHPKKKYEWENQKLEDNSTNNWFGVARWVEENPQKSNSEYYDPIDRLLDAAESEIMESQKSNSMSENTYETKSNYPSHEPYDEINDIEILKKNYGENHDKLNQILDEIKDLTYKEKNLQSMVKETEIKLQKKQNKNKFSQIMKIFSHNNENHFFPPLTRNFA
jgi:uncharacterized repeat protein (TIGR03833 family)